MRAVLGVVVVIALGAVLWWGLRSEDPQPTEHADATAEPEDRPTAPGLTAAGRARERSAPERPAEDPDAGEAERPSVRHVLDGQLIGLDPALPGHAAIEVTGLTAEYQPPKTRPEGSANPDGRFSIDVTPVFDTDKTVVDLQVRVDHPAYLPVTTRVPVTSAPAVEGRRRYETRITLTRAGIITGRVETPRGDPVKAQVGAFFLGEGKPKPYPTVETDEAGRYRLRVGQKGRYLVVAATEGLAPAQGEASVVPGTEVDVPALVIEPGDTIRGQVLFRGAVLPGAGVEAQPRQPDGAWLSVGRQRVVWADGRVLPGRVEATADERGRFEMRGLRPGPFRIWVDTAPGLTVHMACRQDAEQLIEVPAADVVLTLSGCTITLAVVEGNEPVENALLLLQARGGAFSISADASGEVDFLMPAGETYHVRARAKDLPSRALTLEAPADKTHHREVVDLGAKTQKPVLVVTLVAPAGATVDQAGFGFFKADGTRMFPFVTRDVRVVDDRCRIEGLPPGRHLMKVRPGGPWWGGHGFFLQEAVPVEVPADGEAAVRVPIRTGGRLRIAARNENGDFLAPSCTIRDAQGREIEASYVTRLEGGMTASYGSLGSRSISSVDPALPAGTYEIVLKEDRYFPKTVTVEVVAGKAVDVEVTLEPTR